jgi:hypothetical protein
MKRKIYDELLEPILTWISKEKGRVIEFPLFGVEFRNGEPVSYNDGRWTTVEGISITKNINWFTKEVGEIRTKRFQTKDGQSF